MSFQNHCYVCEPCEGTGWVEERIKQCRGRCLKVEYEVAGALRLVLVTGTRVPVPVLLPWYPPDTQVFGRA